MRGRVLSKPNPAMLYELMDELGVQPSEVLMIGDTTHDLQMAGNAGVDALAVSFGAHPKAMLEAEAPGGVHRYAGSAQRMAARERLICASTALREGGDGVRFEVGSGVARRAAFVVRLKACRGLSQRVRPRADRSSTGWKGSSSMNKSGCWSVRRMVRCTTRLGALCRRSVPRRVIAASRSRGARRGVFLLED